MERLCRCAISRPACLSWPRWNESVGAGKSSLRAISPAARASGPFCTSMRKISSRDSCASAPSAAITSSRLIFPEVSKYQRWSQVQRRLATRSLDEHESVGYDRAMAIKRVCVYCASSRQCDTAYHDSAARLGRELARNQVTLVYGGGSVGSMGHLADAALAGGGRVVRVLPRFMYELKWGHRGLSEMLIVNDLHERKRLMIDEVDAVIALPGGCGTLEELFEAITWKRLGLFTGAIVLVNTLGFYSPCVEFLESCIERRFMDERHRAMWSLVEPPEDVLAALANAPPWPRENRDFASL